ncbi:beta-1,4-glucuronyltransferase 1-like [Littorina saxatilis]|uniref:beta-1,4-glucuronyltransferase 1-like n=1 Tax=Littorina saxatilis TaxID=31220 RepID=UPI0038B45DEB
MPRIRPNVRRLCCLAICFILIQVYILKPTQLRKSSPLDLTLASTTFKRLSEGHSTVTAPNDHAGQHEANLVIADVIDRLHAMTKPDKSGSYLLIEDLLTSQELTSQGKPDITLATQCTSHHLHYVAELSKQWEGPLSVAVFTYDDDFHFAIASMLYLHLCVASVAEHVTFHLAFPTERRPDMSIKLPLIHNLCSNPPAAGHISPKNFVIGSGIEYPVNLLRSLAVSRASTTHVFCSDIDMTPSQNLCSGFVRLIATTNTLSQTSTKLAYVVPVFEYSGSRGTIPLKKSALLEKWRRHEIRPFYHNTCSHCQSATDYSRWRALPLDDKMAMAYRVHYHPNYEPFYIAHQSSLPLYDERFKQWGRDRQSQISLGDGLPLLLKKNEQLLEVAVGA